MTVLRPAPKLTPADPAAGIFRLAAWQTYTTHERIGSLESDVRRQKSAIEGWRQEVAKLQANGPVGAQNPHADLVVRVLAALRRRLGEEGIFTFGDVDEETVVAALVDHTATVKAAEDMRLELQRLAGSAEQFLAPFQRSANTLRRAARLASTASATTDGTAAIAAVRAVFPEVEVA